MSDQDIFEDKEAPVADPAPAAVPEQAAPQPSSDPFADQLMEIKKEDGTPKYTDVASALQSIPHAQQHISTIETENAKLKEDLAKAEAAKELLAKQVGSKPEPQQGLTAVQVAEIAAQTMTQAEQAKIKEGNVQTVRSAFSTQYGEKAGEMMQKVAADNGMSVQAVKTLSESAPNAVLKLAGIALQSDGGVPRTPHASTGDNFTPPQPKPAPKSIMGGSNTKDLVANWKAAGEAIQQN